MSTVSSTDVDIFRRLSNPEVVDINVSGSATTRQMASQMRQAIARAVEAAAPPEPPRDADDDEARSEARSDAHSEAPPSRLSQAIAAMASQRAAPSAPQEPSAPQRPSAPGPSAPGPSAASAPPAEPVRRAPAPPTPAASDAGSEEEEEVKSKDPETVRLEKQGYLIDLQALERKGIKLSRAFTMRDSLDAIELELVRQNANLSTASAVNFMRDSLRMAFTGIEMANAKMGPFLSIDGWAESISSDMKRFDHALEKLYLIYFKKHKMSPLMELAWIILGSLVTCHFKNKLFGPAPAPRAAAPPPEPPRAPPARAPRARAAQGTPAVRAAASLGARPTLRPPQAFFGLG